MQKLRVIFMKKLLCLILSISMLVGIVALPAVYGAELGKVETGHAPSGNAVSSAEDFKNMSANGNYYLNADITINESYIGTFKGTLDGNGKTVTTSVALFASLEGTVKNLTVQGDIASVGGNNAAVAISSAGKVTFENVYVKSSILGGSNCAALLANSDGNAEITVKNCRNDGNITASSTAGGLVGYVKTNYVYIESSENHGNVTSASGSCAGILAVGGDGSDASVANKTTVIIKDCKNFGNITSAAKRSAGITAYVRGYAAVENCENHGVIENTTGYAAGILGESANVAKACALLIAYCRNYAEIKGCTRTAGIAVHLGRDSAESGYKYVMIGCENHGDVYGTVSASNTEAVYTCGLVAYTLGGASNSFVNNINTGDIFCTNPSSKNAYVCALIGYVNGKSYEVKNNINTGSITLDGTAYVVSVSIYNKATSVSSSTTVNNYSVASSGAQTLVYGGTPTQGVAPAGSISDENMIKIVTPEKVTSGELVYLANSVAGKQIFFQKLGSDAPITTLSDGTNAVDKDASNNYVNVSGEPYAKIQPDFPDAPYVSDSPEDTPDVSGIVPIVIPENTVTLPASGNVGKVSASYTPEGTPITSAAEFAAMDANGTYYLANDITLTSSYASFTGTLDGNGKTVTTNVPMFTSFAGKIKNLTVEGEIKSSKANNAAVAVGTAGLAVFDNIYNKANIEGGMHVGALLGHAATDAETRITNSRNDGNITGEKNLGGFVGYAENNLVYIANCVNTGSVTAKSTSADSLAAGIIGRFGKDSAVAAKSSCKILNCENYGRIKSVANYAAGMLAYLSSFADIDGCTNYATITNDSGVAAGLLGKSSTTSGSSAIQLELSKNYGNIGGGGITGGVIGSLGSATVESNFIFNALSCENHGDVYVVTQSGSEGTLYVGGISGYAYGGSTENGINNCINTGSISVDNTKTSRTCYVGGLCGYVNSAVFVFNNNISAAKSITATGKISVQTALIYNKAETPTAIANNFAVAIDSLPIARIGTNTSPAESIVKAVTAEQLASGEIAYLINSAAGKNVAFQNLGEDAFPTFVDTTRKTVVKNADGTYANAEEPITPPTVEDTTLPGGDVTTEAPAENTTATPDNTTAATTNEKSCGGFAFAAQIVTILGAGLTVLSFKKKY